MLIGGKSILFWMSITCPNQAIRHNIQLSISEKCINWISKYISGFANFKFCSSANE